MNMKKGKYWFETIVERKNNYPKIEDELYRIAKKKQISIKKLKVCV